jgi:glycosyltransferase involved in cell wall biosynthesis
VALESLGATRAIAAVVPEVGVRILVGADVPPNPDSGAAGTVFATSAALRALGHEVDEIWSSDLEHRIRHWNLHYLLELPRSYRAVVQARQATGDYDVIQLSQPSAWLAAREHRARRRRGIFVNRSHGLESMADCALDEWQRKLGLVPQRFPRSLASRLLRRRLHQQIDKVARYADGMIVPAQDIREHLQRHHGAKADKIAVIPHGVPDEFLSTPQAAMTPDRHKQMLHVGQYSFIKGPQLLARAAATVLASDSQAGLTWVCGREHHESVRALFPAEFRSRVRLHDWVPQGELLALYDSHGIFLAHSLYEGAAKACVEAMARGLAVVSSAVGALKDHVREGENGRLVEVGDTEGMAEAAVGLLGNLEQARHMGACAAGTASRFSWRNCAEAAVEFYRRLLSEHTPRGGR